MGYSQDHVIVLQDWQHESWRDLMASAMTPFGVFEGYKPVYPYPPASLLLNGFGVFDCSISKTFEQCEEERQTGCQCIPTRRPYFGSCGTSSVAEPLFLCTSRARLRLINGSGNMPLRFGIEHHKLLIIAQDGIQLAPNREKLLVDTVLLPVGQRIDVLVDCTNNKGNGTSGFKMMVTLAEAFLPEQPCPYANLSSWATLAYEATASRSGSHAFEFEELGIEEQIKIFDRPPAGRAMAPPARERIVLVTKGAWENGVAGTQLEYWLINNKSWKMPSEPLLQYWKCNGRLMTSSPQSVFQPIIISLQLGAVYEIVLINLSFQQHPWHLHGYNVDFIDVGFNVNGEFNGTSVVTNQPEEILSSGGEGILLIFLFLFFCLKNRFVACSCRWLCGFSF